MKTIARVHLLEALSERQDTQSAQEHQLAELAHRWDGPIRRELRGLAELLWSDEYLLGLIPIHHFRVRYEAGPQVHVWWVEHDIPPTDQHRYTAYRVLLSLDAEKGPNLTVQSGENVYPVTPLREAVLREAIAEAGGDDPLIIPRDMGKAGN